MKRTSIHILRSLLLTTLFVGALAVLLYLLTPQFAHANADLDQLLSQTDAAESRVMWFFYQMVVGLTGFLATLGLDALTYTVRVFVIGFGNFYQTGGLGVALEQVWTIVRDLFNFALIFGIIYIGFKMIIDANDSRAKRTLASLIVAALLVNFSLFIAKAIIEVTNLLATYIAADLLQVDLVTPVSVGAPSQPSLGAPFMDAIGFSSITNIGLLNDITLVGFVYIFMLGIVLTVLAMVSFAGAFLMTIRFISLCIYIVFSPLMFLGWVFPSMAGQSDKFMKGLLGKAFTAPAYLFMLYLSIEVIIQVSNTVRGTGTMSTLVGGAGTGITSAQIGPVIVTFLVSMGFMIASVIVAQKLGANGADASMRVINNIGSRGRRFAQQSAGNLTAGVAARAGRNTVGYGAKRITESASMRRWAAKSQRGAAAMAAAEKVADTSFDVRQVAGVGKAMGVGTGKKGGYSSRLKEDQKRATKFADNLGTENVKDKTLNDDGITSTYKDQYVDTQIKLKTAQERQAFDDARGAQKTAQDAANSDEQKAKRERRAYLEDKQKNNQLADGSKEATELTKLQTELDAEQKKLNDLSSTVDAAAQALTARIKTAETEVEYGRQSDYIQQLETARDTWNVKRYVPNYRGRGPAGDATETAVASGVWVSGAASQSYANDQMAQALIKKYGRSGENAKKSKENDDVTRLLKKAVEKESENNDTSKSNDDTAS